MAVLDRAGQTRCAMVRTGFMIVPFALWGGWFKLSAKRLAMFGADGLIVAEALFGVEAERDGRIGQSGYLAFD